jgi:hypothetical protein
MTGKTKRQIDHICEYLPKFAAYERKTSVDRQYVEDYFRDHNRIGNELYKYLCGVLKIAPRDELL